jgi:hypothetical protein
MEEGINYSKELENYGNESNKDIYRRKVEPQSIPNEEQPTCIICCNSFQGEGSLNQSYQIRFFPFICYWFL